MKFTEYVKDLPWFTRHDQSGDNMEFFYYDSTTDEIKKLTLVQLRKLVK